ncbi:MAG: radical SAM family heme chaperone HemW [Fusobacteriaceae bacterium]
MDAIYIHIPFCNSLCNYCDFLSFSGTKKEDRKKYVDYILKEIDLYPNFNFNTVYFGGGTPSLLEIEDIERILGKLKIDKKAEVTLEINPKTVDLEKLLKLKKIGINRISIGVQSFNNENLKMLGRLHSAEIAIDTYKQARVAGFKEISLDVIFSLPGQKIEDLERDLEQLFLLNPEHFSIYSLIWEENTPFYEKLKKGELKETDNDEEADMFELIISKAKQNNYIHYEISNFSKVGFQAKHNSKYWENKEYLGVGLGASGYFEDIRYKNVSGFLEYYDKIDMREKPILEKEYIDSKAKEEYRNMLGLRLLTKGIKPSKVSKQKFLELLERGYLEKINENYILSKKGLFLANDVFSELI